MGIENLRFKPAYNVSRIVFDSSRVVPSTSLITSSVLLSSALHRGSFSSLSPSHLFVVLTASPSLPSPALARNLPVPRRARQDHRDRKLWNVPSRDARAYGYPFERSSPRLGSVAGETYHGEVSLCPPVLLSFLRNHSSLRRRANPLTDPTFSRSVIARVLNQ